MFAVGTERIDEAGRQLSSKNASEIVTAWRSLGAVLKRAFGAAPEGDDEDTTEPTAEAIREALSHRDIDRALELALRAAHPLRDEHVWVRDVFDDEVIYELSSRGLGDYTSTLFSRSYTITDDGTVTLGDPEAVVMQTVYAPANGDAPSAPSGAADPTAEPTTESIALTSELVPLLERAVRADNTVPLKIIQPGWGSSGFYSPDLLKRDGPKVFTEGLHMYLNHPTETESTERPERSVLDLAGRLTTNAVWQENGPAGPGLYADAEVFAPFRDVLDEIAPHIGVSIRAAGRISEGEADGRHGRIVEELVQAESVDWVTRAGAGGQVVTIMESARGARMERVAESAPAVPVTQEVGMEELQEVRDRLKAVETENARLRGIALLGEARTVANGLLAAADLPAFAKRRILESVTADPAEKDGALDKDALKAAVESQVQAWRTDLAEAGAGFRIEGMGPSNGEPLSDEALDGVMAEAFTAMGLQESTAKLAARGR